MEFWIPLAQGVALGLTIVVLTLAIVMFVALMHDIVKKSTVTWKEKEIENPVAKFLIIVFGFIFAAIYGILVVGAGVLLMLLWGCLCGAVLVALSPLWIPAHFVLKAYGRRGFFTIEGSTYSLAFNREAFDIVEK